MHPLATLNASHLTIIIPVQSSRLAALESSRSTTTAQSDQPVPTSSSANPQPTTHTTTTKLTILHPIYKPLDKLQPLYPKDQPPHLKDLDTALIHLLSQANPPSEAQTLLHTKARQKTLLLENPAIKPKRSLQKKPKRHSARLASKTSLKKRGLLFTTTNDDDVLTWEAVQPLFQRWKAYLQTILALPIPNSSNNNNNNKSSSKKVAAFPGSIVAEKLVLLDLHGCLLRIKQSEEGRWTGMQGIVIKETLNTIEMVVKEGDRVVRVPKERCVFEFDVDSDGRRVAVLQGSSMMLPSRIF